MPNESRVIVTCMKNEGPYILEWIAYHLHIGFTHFVVATNNCSDGTGRMLNNLQREGIVTHVANPPPHPRGPQKTGYFRCRDLEVVRNADWLMTLDADEFLNIYEGDGTLDALMRAAPRANLFSFQWLMFGYNGRIAFEDRPVIEQFNRAAHHLQILPTILRSFKTLYRGGLYAKLGTHRPNEPIEAMRDRIAWVDGSGRPMPDHYIDRGWAGELNGEGLGVDLGRINHYAVRSLEGFMIKRDRGDVNPARHHGKNQDSGLSYWRLHNWNPCEDTSIQRHLPATLAGIDDLKARGRIAGLHREGVRWHISKAAELTQRRDMADLKAAILDVATRPFAPDPAKFRAPEAGTRTDYSRS